MTAHWCPTRAISADERRELLSLVSMIATSHVGVRDAVRLDAVNVGEARRSFGPFDERHRSGVVQSSRAAGDE